MSQNNENAPAIFLPAQGSIIWYEQILKILDNRRIPRVDKTFLSNQNPKIASGNESKLIAGLKFLGLIDKEGNATPLMDSLSLKGEKRRENLEKVVRTSYTLLFDKLKMDLANIDSDTLTNAFLSDYGMGSPNTANQAAIVFVSLAQKAGLQLSESISKMLTPIETKKIKPNTEKTITQKKPKEIITPTKVAQPETIPENVLARFTYKGVGVVDITDKDTFELAKGFFNLLAKKLEITEE